VLDGGEGCGKSTQIGLLTQRLLDHGISTLCVRDPGATPVSEAIRQILLNPANDDMAMRCEMLLYMAARAQLMAQRISPAMSAGQWVVSDRFVSSTLAYQLGGDGLTAEEILSVARVALAGRLPDLTLLLDMPVELSQARVLPKFQIPLPLEGAAETAHAETHRGVVKDRIEQRPLDYHRKVRENFLAQAKADPGRVKVIQAGRPAAEVAEEIWGHIAPLL
jgi:dTMP kinase